METNYNNIDSPLVREIKDLEVSASVSKNYKYFHEAKIMEVIKEAAELHAAYMGLNHEDNDELLRGLVTLHNVIINSTNRYILLGVMMSWKTALDSSAVQLRAWNGIFANCGMTPEGLAKFLNSYIEESNKLIQEKSEIIKDAIESGSVSKGVAIEEAMRLRLMIDDLTTDVDLLVEMAKSYEEKEKNSTSKAVQEDATELANKKANNSPSS